jgi:hypothetical protein
MILRMNSSLFRKYHYTVGLYNIDTNVSSDVEDEYLNIIEKEFMFQHV